MIPGEPGNEHCRDWMSGPTRVGKGGKGGLGQPASLYIPYQVWVWAYGVEGVNHVQVYDAEPASCFNPQHRQ